MSLQSVDQMSSDFLPSRPVEVQISGAPLYLHAMTLNLLVRLRRSVAQPPKRPVELGLPNPLPAQALDEPDRRRYFNRLRERDPMGEGFACTCRTRLIKVAAEIVTSARRVVVGLSASWPKARIIRVRSESHETRATPLFRACHPTRQAGSQ